MVTVVQGKVCAKNHPDRLSRLATIHQRYRQTDRQTDRRISYGIGLDLTVGQKVTRPKLDCVQVAWHTYSDDNGVYIISGLLLQIQFGLTTQYNEHETHHFVHVYHNV